MLEKVGGVFISFTKVITMDFEFIVMLGKVSYLDYPGMF